MLAVDCLLQGDQRGAFECMNNIYLAKTQAMPERDPFQSFIELRALWKDLMTYFSSQKVSREVYDLLQFPKS